MPTLTPSTATDRSKQMDFMLALFRPWLRTEEAGFLLDDASEWHVRDLIDEGKLLAINIAVGTDTRRDLRVYRYSVEHRIMAPHRELTIVSPEEIIPHHRPTVLRRELASWLACSEAHVGNLQLDGPRDGSDTRHRIYRASAVSFLTERLIKP
jgi:hypothetical protein